MKQALDWKSILGVLVLAVVGLWIYQPVLHGDWLWDDDVLITQNSLVHDPSGLWEIWLEPGKLLDYQPVEITIFWLEWRLWGGDTFGYHLVNVALHFLGALLLWRLLAKFGLRLAWLGALLFVVHPVTVESVAWISEFKNTLSLPPFLCAMICWIDYEKRGRRRDYRWALGWFLLAMLIKTSMAMFPFVLLLYAWWKRGRVTQADLKAGAPFFAVSLVMGLLTVWFLHHHAVNKDALGGLWDRLALAGLSLSFYFSKCFLPVELLPIYPQWPMFPLSAWQFLPWPVLLGILYWFWTKRAGWGRHALLGLGFFILMLVPFIGFTNGSYMRFTWVMDHLVYIPLVGLIGLTVAALDRLETRLPRASLPFGRGLVAVALGLMAFESHGYARLFSSQETLWTYTLRYNPDAQPAHSNLGLVLAGEGRLSEAMIQLVQAVRLKPDDPDAHSNLGIVLGQSGHLPEAIGEFDEALRLKPDLAPAHDNLGIALRRSGRVSEAIEQIKESLRLDPHLAGAHNNLGIALSQAGRLHEAGEQFEQALRDDPNNAAARDNLTKLQAMEQSAPVQ